MLVQPCRGALCSIRMRAGGREGERGAARSQRMMSINILRYLRYEYERVEIYVKYSLWHAVAVAVWLWICGEHAAAAPSPRREHAACAACAHTPIPTTTASAGFD